MLTLTLSKDAWQKVDVLQGADGDTALPTSQGEIVVTS